MRTLKAKKYAFAKNINYLQTLKQERKFFLNDFYKKVKYKGSPKIVDVRGNVGLELDRNIERYFQLAASFIDSHAKKIEFKFKECERIWPSGIALFCSFKQWVEITSKEKQQPMLLSSDADDDQVNSYLAHCGFYDYVNRVHTPASTDFSPKEIVKIHRESDSKKCLKEKMKYWNYCKSLVLSVTKNEKNLGISFSPKFLTMWMNMVIITLTEDGGQ